LTQLGIFFAAASAGNVSTVEGDTAEKIESDSSMRTKSLVFNEFIPSPAAEKRSLKIAFRS
jgi:hypothetical protein